jgi:hypothetical protein
MSQIIPHGAVSPLQSAQINGITQMQQIWTGMDPMDGMRNPA